MPNVTITMTYKESSEARHCVALADGSLRWLPTPQVTLDPVEPAAGQAVNVTMPAELAERAGIPLSSP